MTSNDNDYKLLHVLPSPDPSYVLFYGVRSHLIFYLTPGRWAYVSGNWNGAWERFLIEPVGGQSGKYCIRQPHVSLYLGLLRDGRVYSEPWCQNDQQWMINNMGQCLFSLCLSQLQTLSCFHLGCVPFLALLFHLFCVYAFPRTWMFLFIFPLFCSFLLSCFLTSSSCFSKFLFSAVSLPSSDNYYRGKEFVLKHGEGYFEADANGPSFSSDVLSQGITWRFVDAEPSRFRVYLIATGVALPTASSSASSSSPASSSPESQEAAAPSSLPPASTSSSPNESGSKTILSCQDGVLSLTSTKTENEQWEIRSLNRFDRHLVQIRSGSTSCQNKFVIVQNNKISMSIYSSPDQEMQNEGINGWHLVTPAAIERDRIVARQRLAEKRRKEAEAKRKAQLAAEIEQERKAQHDAVLQQQKLKAARQKILNDAKAAAAGVMDVVHSSVESSIADSEVRILRRHDQLQNVEKKKAPRIRRAAEEKQRKEEIAAGTVLALSN